MTLPFTAHHISTELVHTNEPALLFTAHDVLTSDPLPTGAHQRVTRCEWSTPTVRSWQPTDPSAHRECECVLTTRNLTVGWLVGCGLEVLNSIGAVPSSDAVACHRRLVNDVNVRMWVVIQCVHPAMHTIINVPSCQQHACPNVKLMIVQRRESSNYHASRQRHDVRMWASPMYVLKNEFSKRPVTFIMISMQLKIQNATC